MLALVIACHGSRKHDANMEVLQLAKHVEQITAERFEVVRAGFLEFAEPSIAEAIDNCVQLGATSITVVPYFLVFGNHVQRDIPHLVNVCAQKHQHVSFRLTPHLGASADMPGLVIQAAEGQ